MAQITRRAFTRFAVASLLAAHAPRGFSQIAGTNTSATPGALRIGYQKSSTLITLLKARGSLKKHSRR